MVKIEYLTGTTVSIFIFAMGIYGLISRKNILNSIISLSIIQSAIILFFIDSTPGDPIAEGLMITAIVIGVAVSATTLMIFIHLYHEYGTIDWQKLHERRNDHL